jgi:hypothetical protein
MKRLLLSAAVVFAAACSYGQGPGNALNFDGSDDYASASVPALFTDIANNDFTFEAWVRVNGTGTQRVVFIQNTSTEFFSILLNGSNEVYAYVYDGDNYSDGINTSTTLTTNQWAHLAVTWDASADSITIFIDGAPELTNSGGGSSNGTDGVMAIGSRSDGTQNLNGDLDEVAIWSEVRSECDILIDMTSEMTQGQPNLIAYYNFNQGTAGGNNAAVTTLTDQTAGFNANLYNFALNGTSSNWVASGANITSADQTAEATATVNGLVITADAPNATYRWLDCDNGDAVIFGETGQSYTASGDGNFAVEVTRGNCVDTSDCIEISTLELTVMDPDPEVYIYPNPTNDVVYLNYTLPFESGSVFVLGADGRIVNSIKLSEAIESPIQLGAKSGVYFIEIIVDSDRYIKRVVKQ